MCSGRGRTRREGGCRRFVVSFRFASFLLFFRICFTDIQTLFLTSLSGHLRDRRLSIAPRNRRSTYGDASTGASLPKQLQRLVSFGTKARRLEGNGRMEQDSGVWEGFDHEEGVRGVRSRGELVFLSQASLCHIALLSLFAPSSLTFRFVLSQTLHQYVKEHRWGNYRTG